jgi:hypothetical protein
MRRDRRAFAADSPTARFQEKPPGDDAMTRVIEVTLELERGARAHSLAGSGTVRGERTSSSRSVSTIHCNINRGNRNGFSVDTGLIRCLTLLSHDHLKSSEFFWPIPE